MILPAFLWSHRGFDICWQPVITCTIFALFIGLVDFGYNASEKIYKSVVMGFEFLKCLR